MPPSSCAKTSSSPLEDYLPRLGTLTFQTKLGSMLDKTRRIDAAGGRPDPARWVWSAEETAVARRAADLCKADLVTHMVVEMTSLQGQIGRQYALRSGEPPAVATPSSSTTCRALPAMPPRAPAPGWWWAWPTGWIRLAGLFAAGLAPTGNKDPFAQRRAALGLVQNLIAWDLDLDLRQVLQAAADAPAHPGQRRDACPPAWSSSSSACATCCSKQAGATMWSMPSWPSRAPTPPARRVPLQPSSAWVARPDWHTILPAYARCVRITRSLRAGLPGRPAELCRAGRKRAVRRLAGRPKQPRASPARWMISWTPSCP